MVFRACHFGLSTLVRWICDTMDAQRVVKNMVPYITHIVLSTISISGVTFSEHCTPQISSAQLIYKMYNQYRHHYHMVTVAWPVLQLVYVASVRHSRKTYSKPRLYVSLVLVLLSFFLKFFTKSYVLPIQKHAYLRFGWFTQAQTSRECASCMPIHAYIICV